MLHKFLRLSSAQKRQFLQAFMFMLQVRVRLKIYSFPKFLKWYKQVNLNQSVEVKSFSDIKLAVNRAAKLLVNPKKPCLPKALTAFKICSANGIESSVVIGITKELQEFKAHAWLLLDEQVVLGWLPNLHEYKELTRFEEL